MRRFAALALVAAAGIAAGLGIYRMLAPATPSAPPPAASPEETIAEIDPSQTAYRCYFPTRGGWDLAEEIRVRDKPEGPLAAVHAVFEELHRGPALDNSLPLFPKGTAPRAIYLLPDGSLYVDEPAEAFSRPLGLREEFLFVRAIARSLLRNCPEVSSFAFLANGSARYRLFTHYPAHGKYVLPK